MLDSLIIGGGPAGLTAGIYLMRAGLSCALYEKQFCGGQAATTNWILKTTPDSRMESAGRNFPWLWPNRRRSLGWKSVMMKSRNCT